MVKYHSKSNGNASYLDTRENYENVFERGLNYVKNSRVGKLIYSPEVEGKALKEIRDGFKNTAKGIYYLAKEMPHTLKNKESRSEFWDNNKYIILPIAVGAAATIITNDILTRLSGVKGIGWDFDPLAPNSNVWQAATRTVNFNCPFNYPTQSVVTAPTPEIAGKAATFIEKTVNDNAPFRLGASLIAGTGAGSFTGGVCGAKHHNEKK